MTKTLVGALAALVLAGTASPARAQWLKHPTPGIPRNADGTPNLSAPAPRTPDGRPDLSGVWGLDAGPYAFYVAGELKPDEIAPWAQKLVQERDETLGRNDPGVLCLPEGPRFNHFLALPKKIVQTPNLIVVLSEDLSYRQIFLDGRALPKDPQPSFMGYSVGRWEGDTLVVQSTGYKESTWLDFAGHPHTERLRITERWRRLDYGRMEIQETLEDPEIYKRPITVPVRATLVPDTDLLEYVCAENEKDRDKLIGTLSQTQKAFTPAKVDSKVLAPYAGTYDWRYPENPTVPSLMIVTFSDGLLRLGGAPLIPISETKFLWGSSPLEFVKDAQGRVTHFVSVWVEGDLVAKRTADK
jgi:hypothetical protein